MHRSLQFQLLDIKTEPKSRFVILPCLNCHGGFCDSGISLLSLGFHDECSFVIFNCAMQLELNFWNRPLLATDPIDDLLAQESLFKPLSYLVLLSVEPSKMEKLWEAWRADIPTLDREDWEDCFKDSSKWMVTSRDKLIQTKFQRVCTILLRLHRIYPQSSPDCSWRLFVHIFICFEVALGWRSFGRLFLSLSISIFNCPFWFFLN